MAIDPIEGSLASSISASDGLIALQLLTLFPICDAGGGVRPTEEGVEMA